MRHHHKCTRCGYEWLSTLEHPVRCARRKCKSPYWNRERVWVIINREKDNDTDLDKPDAG